MREDVMKTRIWLLLGTLLIAGSLFAGPITYAVTMSGPNESPANASPGTGFALIIIDSTANTLRILSDSFAGLTGTTTASHIHCCTVVPLAGPAGVATQVPTFSGFPLGATSGSYTMLFDMTLNSTWNPAFVTASGGTPAGAEAVLVAGAAAGEAYLNIHSTTFVGGEIRGFLVPAPEPGTITLAIGALAGLIFVSKFRRTTRSA
jgi:hypothetical protein